MPAGDAVPLARPGPSRRAAAGAPSYPAPQTRMIWIAVDAMGGDAAPADRRWRDRRDAAFRSWRAARRPAPAARIRAARVTRDLDRDRVRLVDADSVVEMAESPSAALRRKPNASIKVAAEGARAAMPRGCSAPGIPARR